LIERRYFAQRHWLVTALIIAALSGAGYEPVQKLFGPKVTTFVVTNEDVLQTVVASGRPPLNPRLILADEPTGDLDTQTANSVFELMRQVSAASGTTVLLVTHNMDLAGRCDRVIAPVDGSIVSDRAVST
jgi:ABC-type polar amino acid transport system ATPase subunit